MGTVMRTPTFSQASRGPPGPLPDMRSVLSDAVVLTPPDMPRRSALEAFGGAAR